MKARLRVKNRSAPQEDNKEASALLATGHVFFHAWPVDLLTVALLPIDLLPIDLLTVDLLPIDLLPVDLLPIDLLPVDLLPIDLLPVDLLTVELLPIDLLPVDLLPLNMLPATSFPLSISDPRPSFYLLPAHSPAITNRRAKPADCYGFRSSSLSTATLSDSEPCRPPAPIEFQGFQAPNWPNSSFVDGQARG